MRTRSPRYDLPEVSCRDEGRQAKSPQEAEVDLSEMPKSQVSGGTNEQDVLKHLAQPLIVVFNWFEEFTRLVPTP